MRFCNTCRGKKKVMQPNQGLHMAKMCTNCEGKGFLEVDNFTKKEDPYISIVREVVGKMDERDELDVGARKPIFGVGVGHLSDVTEVEFEEICKKDHERLTSVDQRRVEAARSGSVSSGLVIDLLKNSEPRKRGRPPKSQS